MASDPYFQHCFDEFSTFAAAYGLITGVRVSRSLHGSVGMRSAMTLRRILTLKYALNGNISRLGTYIFYL